MATALGRKALGGRFRVALLALVLLATSGCRTAEQASESLAGDVARARDLEAVGALRQAQATAALVRSESGGGYGSGAASLARLLRARDPSTRYTTGPPKGPEEVQVIGGGALPLTLVSRSPSSAYLAIWDGGSGETLYYRGASPPALAAYRPSGSGWTGTPPG